MPRARIRRARQRGKGSLDVDAFRRLLLTGQAGGPAQASPSPPTGQLGTHHGASVGDGGSLTDASSISRQSIFDTTHLQETPRTSHEISEAEVDEDRHGLISRTPTKKQDPPTTLRKKPPPPSSRHGKLIKVELKDENKHLEEKDSLEAFPALSSPSRPRPSTPSDVNKPLPPAPEGFPVDGQESVFDHEAAGKIPELDDADSEIADLPPPRPPTPLRSPIRQPSRLLLLRSHPRNPRRRLGDKPIQGRRARRHLQSRLLSPKRTRMTFRPPAHPWTPIVPARPASVSTSVVLAPPLLPLLAARTTPRGRRTLLPHRLPSASAASDLAMLPAALRIRSGRQCRANFQHCPRRLARAPKPAHWTRRCRQVAIPVAVPVQSPTSQAMAGLYRRLLLRRDTRLSGPVGRRVSRPLMGYRGESLERKRGRRTSTTATAPPARQQ